MHESLCGRAELANEEDVHLVGPEVEQTRRLVGFFLDKERVRLLVERECASMLSSSWKRNL